MLRDVGANRWQLGNSLYPTRGWMEGSNFFIQMGLSGFGVVVPDAKSWQPCCPPRSHRPSKRFGLIVFSGSGPPRTQPQGHCGQSLNEI